MSDQTRGATDASHILRPSRICAVIVTYNIGAEVHRCFNAIHDQVGHVLIVDNASDEATRTELDRLVSPGVTVILNPSNHGLARAYNQAVQWAREAGFHWLLLLDDDSEATPGMVQVLSDTHAQLTSQGIGNIAVLAANPFELSVQRYLLYGPPQQDRTWVEDDDAMSSGSLLRLSVFNETIRFDDSLFIYYVDADFCRRLTRAGHRVLIALNAVLLHREGDRRVHKFLWRTATYNHYSRHARYYLMRNAVYLLRKGILRSSDLRWVLHHYWKDHLKIIVFDRGRFAVLWYSLRGFIDGMRGKMGPL